MSNVADEILKTIKYAVDRKSQIISEIPEFKANK